MDVDPVIRRIGRTALVACAAATAAAFAIRPDRPSIAAGILGGGLLVFVSLFAIRGSIDAVLGTVGPPGPAGGPPAGAAGPGGAAGDGAPPRAGAGTAVKVAGRFALLGLAAYVMIARLRLHPIGLLIGASSLVAGAALEAARGLRRS